MGEVYDLQGIGPSHTSCITGLALMSRILSVGQLHYPENLHKAVILNVPTLAFKMLWPIVEKVLDVRTRQKILMSNRDGREIFTQTLHMSQAEVNAMFNSLPPYNG